MASVIEPLFQIAPCDLAKIGILACEHCGNAVTVIARIEAPALLKKILEHLDRRAGAATLVVRPFARAPPHQQLPGLKDPS